MLNRYELLELLTGYPYSGELLFGPIPPAARGLLSPPHTEEDLTSLLHQERTKRIPALFNHFGIRSDAPDAWQALALAMAARHVPGFQWNRIPDIDTESNLGIGAQRFLRINRFQKRPRGRPRSIAPHTGLLAIAPPPSQVGRPATYTLAEKADFVAWFAECKEQHGTKKDQATAEALVSLEMPSARKDRIERKAAALVKRIRQWRWELNASKNSQENQT